MKSLVMCFLVSVCVCFTVYFFGVFTAAFIMWSEPMYDLGKWDGVIRLLYVFVCLPISINACMWLEVRRLTKQLDE